MISSIFGKTKPINYIIVLTFLFLFYWVVRFVLFNMAYEPADVVFQLGVFGFLSFSFFAVNFVVKRNKITGTNSYAILFFALLMVIFPETLMDNNAILCNFFLLLAVRRLISIKSLKKIKFKVFDATLWIMFASLFYDWALLYLVMVVITIYIYEPKNFKNWLVPFVAIFVMLMISYTVLVLAGNKEYLSSHYQLSVAFDAQYYLNWANSSKLIIYALLVFLVSIYVFVKLGKSGVGKVVVTRLIVFLFLIGLIINVLVSSQDLHPILLTFFPTAVLLTNYVESIKRSNIKEMVLIISIFIPFTVFISMLIFK